MKFYKTFFVPLLLFFSTFFQAQENKEVDSILKVLKTQADDSLKIANLHYLFDYYVYKDTEKAKYYADEEIRVSKSSSYETGLANGLYNYGVYYNTLDKPDSAKVYYQKAYNIFEKKNNEAGKYSASYGLAIIELDFGNFDKALELTNENIDIYKTRIKDSIRLAMQYDFFAGIHTAKGNFKIALTNNLKAVRILENENKPIRLADALSHLADTELDLEDYEKSLEHKLKALKIYNENNDKYYATAVLNDIGNTYYYSKNYNKSIEYLKQGLIGAEELNLVDIKGTLLNNLGKAYAQINDFDNAFLNINKALKIAVETNNDYKKIEIFNNLGEAYNSGNNPKEALSNYNKAIILGEKFGKPTSLQISYLNRSTTYSNLKQFELALKDFKQHKNINDSLYSAKKIQQIEELRTIYDTEKKEQQIVLQENEIGLLEEKEKVSNLQKITLGGGLGLSTLVIGFGFYGFRQKMKRNKLEKEKVDAELAFKKKELTTHAMHLAKKSEVLENVKQKAKELKKLENGERSYQQLIQTINFDQQDDKNWENFTQYFEQVHKDFSKTVQIKYPEVTKNELRLMALLKMNLSSKEIATILNISSDGVKKARQRLRKKMQLSPEESLESTVLSI